MATAMNDVMAAITARQGAPAPQAQDLTPQLQAIATDDNAQKTPIANAGDIDTLAAQVVALTITIQEHAAVISQMKIEHDALVQALEQLVTGAEQEGMAGQPAPTTPAAPAVPQAPITPTV